MTTATFDLNLYPQVAVIKAVHRFSGTHAIQLERGDYSITVTLKPRMDGLADPRTELLDAVVDETLREVVYQRTQAIHDTLVMAAFAPVRTRS